MGHAVIFIIVIVLAVGGVGYYVFSKHKDSTNANLSPAEVASSKAVADACNKALNDKDFCKFASNWKGLESYKSTITTTTKDGTSAFAVEAESSTKSKTTTSTGGKESSAFVTIGNDFYTKDESDGSWTKYVGSATKEESSNIKDDIKVSDFSTDSTATGKTQYKKIGKEPCGNLTCFKYQVIDPSTPTTDQFIWFDTKDYLLRRWSSKDADGTTDMTISYEKVSVSVPSPIKSTIDSSSSSSGGAPTQAQIDAAMKAAESFSDNSDDSGN